VAAAEVKLANATWLASKSVMTAETKIGVQRIMNTLTAEKKF